jgi:hypothetical protein
MSKLNDVVYCTIEHKKYRVLSRLITTHRLNLNLGMKIQISKMSMNLNTRHTHEEPLQTILALSIINSRINRISLLRVALYSRCT